MDFGRKYLGIEPGEWGHIISLVYIGLSHGEISPISLVYLGKEPGEMSPISLVCLG